MKNDKQKIIFSTFLFLILLTIVTDLWQDWADQPSMSHLFTEGIVCILILAGLIFLWANNLFLKKELIYANSNLLNSMAEAIKWKAENSQLISGLALAIDKQLIDWSLTPSEKEVAHLLLKGLLLKEIAEIRSVSERTVRQQSVAIYQKSNLNGRAELSAFFLEDLLK